jgi:cobaltochelatase CobN
LRYFAFPEVVNCENLIKYILNKEYGENFEIKPPRILEKVFSAHPDTSKFFTKYNDYLTWYKKSGHYKKDGFWVGINYYRPMVNDDFISELVKKIEKSGINVIVLYSFPDYLSIKKFLLPHKVDMLLGISFKFSASLDKKGKTSIAKLNVPVYNGISLFQTSESAWAVSGTGLTPFEVSFQVSLPELAGIIEPTVIASKERIFDSSVQKDIFVTKPIEYQIDMLIKRMKAMRKLQVIPEKDKKIAIIYYNHHPGKQNIGASYLNVMRSLSNILSTLRRVGYKIPKKINLDYDTLKSAMLLSGRNVGNYAPGEMEKLVNSGKVVLLPIKEYKKWIKNAPENFINPVYKKWGKPKDSKIMVYKGNFIIPMVKISNNIIILPQPSRGWGQSPIKMYHDVTLPPHHQYIAVYLWLKKVFKADCFINLGTHGTHEWMPGKQAGTIYWDNGDFLVQDIPVLYPYIPSTIDISLLSISTIFSSTNVQIAL